ncbi:unnamed protein product [Rotaria socialis]|uniref:Uncharacterized protein n=1 Tax=Rotaria socialis TaxID=392032 RepID=A0A818L0E1_9BILA|nr:unnamed protein product [Rotaria socialis]CAF4698185.1 unnamed protein product [Rotaria socialis]
MEVIEVAQCESDKSDEEVAEENDGINGNKRIPKKKKLAKCWIKESTFDNAGEAEASIIDKCLGELEKWCQNNVNVPTDENEAFVVSYKILYDNEDDEDVEEKDDNKFRILISSLHLLNIISMSSHLCSDATYKLVWQSFPVLIVGTTDFNKAFHLC